VTPELQARHRQVKEILTLSLMQQQQQQQCSHVDSHEQQTVIVTNSSDIDIKKMTVDDYANTFVGRDTDRNFTATHRVRANCNIF
jgi:hypothetical protein